MNSDQQKLMQRLEQFEIDAPDAVFPYSARLAQANHWTPAFTARVIAEYKRFAFLACEAGHMVVPSEAVDEAWHTHLIYTDNYWSKFCEVLGKPLHHWPSNGGADEDARFRDLYGQTLASYERLFGEVPPRDVWPRPGVTKLKPVGHGLRSRSMLFLSILLLGAGVTAGCAANPFDWRGPQFLQFYLLLFTAMGALAVGVRHLLLRPTDGPPAADLSLTEAEIAYLNGGANLALDLTLTRMHARGLLEVDEKNGKIRASESGYPEVGLEEEIYRRCRPDFRSVDLIRSGVAPFFLGVRDRLQSLGLLVSEPQIALAKVIPAGIFLMAPLIGVIKIWIGIERHRPVGFLILLCLVSVALTLVFLATVPRRSRYGSKVLAELRARNAYLAPQGKVSPRAAPQELLLGVALFGLPILATTEHAPLARALRPTGADGGGADGGGSSCGGGGGCGGGCGGCGG
jgi:uncharacterized protein (TIGR04222 family)